MPAGAAREVLIPDDVLALVVAGDRLGVLGRRSFQLYRMDPAALSLTNRVELDPYMDTDRALPRRPMGWIGAAPDGAAFDLWSGLLDPRTGLRLILQGDLLTPSGAAVQIPGWLNVSDVTGPAARVVSLGEESTRFRLDTPGRLIATTVAGELLHIGDATGEPLTARAAGEGGSVFVTDLSPPGTPDRILEYRWDGTSLQPGRRSRTFAGRIAALTFVDGHAALALTQEPGRSLCLLLPENELWEAMP